MESQNELEPQAKFPRVIVGALLGTVLAIAAVFLCLAYLQSHPSPAQKFYEDCGSSDCDGYSTGMILTFIFIVLPLSVAGWGVSFGLLLDNWKNKYGQVLLVLSVGGLLAYTFYLSTAKPDSSEVIKRQQDISFIYLKP